MTVPFCSNLLICTSDRSSAMDHPHSWMTIYDRIYHHFVLWHHIDSQVLKSEPLYSSNILPVVRLHYS